MCRRANKLALDLPLICLLFAISGCVWVGDSLERFPPLVMNGQLLDADGKTMASQQCVVAVTSWDHRIETAKHLLDDSPDAKSHQYCVFRMRTDSAGCLYANWPARQNTHSACGTLVPPMVLSGNRTKRDIVVLIRAGQKGNPVYEIYLHGNRLKSIRRHSIDQNGHWNEEKVAPCRGDTVELLRSEDCDRLRFTLRIR